MLLLSKEREGFTWPAVTAEEAKIKEKNKGADPAKSTEDPSSSIMGLMKKMYDDGDDKMKQVSMKGVTVTKLKACGWIVMVISSAVFLLVLWYYTTRMLIFSGSFFSYPTESYFSGI